MNIEDLKSLMDSFDPASLLPELDSILGDIAFVVRVATLLGPILLLVLGLGYLLLSPKEANYIFGYRCTFGMGSVEAWRYTQRLAGGIWALLGLGLAIWMAIAGGQLAELSMVDAMAKMAVWILWQAVALLLSRLLINVLVFLRFDRKGNRRYTWAELWKG